MVLELPGEKIGLKEKERLERKWKERK